MITAVLGTVIPSFVVILLVAMFFTDIRENPTVERIFRGIRPAVVSLIVVPVVNMLKKSGFSPFVVSLATIAALAVWLFGVSPVWVIAAAGVTGVIYHSWIAKEHPEK